MSVFTVILLDCVTEKRSKAMEEKFFYYFMTVPAPLGGQKRHTFAWNLFHVPGL